jgi:site-specific DNA recombinase
MAANAPENVHLRIVPSFYLLSGLLYCSCGRAMIGRSAKSHHYYYYVCNRSYKQGKDSCNARPLAKEKIEKLVIEQIKARILTRECLEELVRLVNIELDSASSMLNDRMDAIDTELIDVTARLSKLYEVLETGKLNLDDLALRIKELNGKKDELIKSRVQTEADMVLEGVHHVDAEVVKSYAQDLQCLLQEADFTQSKAFLRSFVKRIIIDGNKARIHYRLPMPPDGKKTLVGVLPINTPSGLGGIRTLYLITASDAFSQVNYGPAETPITLSQKLDLTQLNLDGYNSRYPFTVFGHRI